jgi:plastocyanin
MHLRRILLLTFAGLALGAAPALGASTVTVDVGGSSLTFTQPKVTINPGDTIHWVWQGSNHSVTSGSLPPASNGFFDDGVHLLGHTFDETFTQPGVYHYFCKIHYALGMRGTVVVNGTAPSPTAAFTPSTTAPLAGQPVSFDASASSAPTGYTLDSFQWDFGDGQTQVTASATTTHSYATVGAHTVSLTVVSDASAASAAVTQQLTVTTPPEQPPIASFTVTPGAPTAGTPVHFDASASSASTGHTLASYRWTFGDGASATTSGPTTSHTYAAPGPETARLVVVDDLGMASATATRTLVVAAVPPPAPRVGAAHLGAVKLCARKTRHCARVSTTVRFALSRAASVAVVIERGTHKLRRRVIAGTAGKNTLALSAKGLKSGRYTLVLTPKGGKPARLRFTVRTG